VNVSAPIGAPRLIWCEYALVDGRVCERVAIGVAGHRFTSIEADVECAPDARRLSGLTVSGLANTHSHAFHRALRHRTQTGHGSFWTWRELMYTAAAALDPDSMHRLARATFAEMALAGVTCVGEFHYLHHQPDGTPYDDPNAMGAAVLAAADDAGIRVTLLDTLYLHGGIVDGSYVEPDQRQQRFCDVDAAHWAERVGALAPARGQQIGAAVHSVRAVDPASIRIVAEWAAAAGQPVHAHVSEQPAENDQCIAAHGSTPTALLDEAGLLGPWFTAVHATHLTPDDVHRLGASGASVCLCPTTERDLGDGVGPSRGLDAVGVAMSLGSDSHAVIDMFEEARAVELDERLISHDRGAFGASELFDMAAIAGHRSLGWADAGKIRVGNRADLVTISLGSPRLAGWSAANLLDALVFAATASDVTDVMVDGCDVVTDGVHRSVDVAAELHASINELLG
jgi:formiminoglutamate deiminase